MGKNKQKEHAPPLLSNYKTVSVLQNSHNRNEHCISIISKNVFSVEEFKAKKSIENEQTRRLERQASAERQKVYEDVFLEEMQHYIQYGATESKKLNDGRVLIEE